MFYSIIQICIRTTYVFYDKPSVFFFCLSLILTALSAILSLNDDGSNISQLSAYVSSLSSTYRISIINAYISLFWVYFYFQLQRYESRLKSIFILNKKR